MYVLYGILCFLVFMTVPGYALLRWLRPKQGAARLGPIEAVVLVLSISILVTSLVGIVLAEFGVFNVFLLLLIVAGVALVVSLPRRGKLLPLEKPVAWRFDVVFLVAVMVVGAVLYFRPHEYIFGGWDPSTYLSTGASIERTGGILYRDESFGALPREMQDALSYHRQFRGQRFPAMLIADHETGLISPQFHHLYPTWLAIFRSLGGDEAMLYANSVFALLSVFMLFIMCRRFLATGTAFAATILFALNLTQIWQARFSTAEVLAQLCILTMLYLLMLYWETGSPAAALLSMLAMGMAAHARLDALLVVPLVALLVYAHNLARWRGRDWLLVAGGAVAVAHIVLHSVFISFLYRPGVQLVTSRPVFFAVIGAGVLAILVVVFAAFRLWPKKLAAFVSGPWSRAPLVALLVVFAFYAFFVRPYLGSPKNVNRMSFVALGWFLTPVGLALAVVGACVLVAKARSLAELTLIVVGAVMTIVYTKYGLIEPFYMWAARRYVPVVIPLLCVFGGYAVATITTGLGRWRTVACIVVAVLIAAVPLARGRAIVLTRDNRGTLDFVAEVAAELDPDGVYVCNHYWLATPLNLLHGFETYAVSDPDAKKCRVALHFAQKKLDEGRAVYFVDMDRPHIFPGLTCVPIEAASYAFRSTRLEQSKGFPRQTEPVRFEANVYRLVRLDEAPGDTAQVDLTWEFEPDWFHVGEGFLKDYHRAIDVVETPGGERLEVSQAPKDSEIRGEFACWTGRRSALWIPYDPTRSYVAELRLSGRGGVKDAVTVSISGQRLTTIAAEESFRTVSVMIPSGIATGTPRRALLEIVSLAPPEEKEPSGMLLDQIRLRSVEEEVPVE